MKYSQITEWCHEIIRTQAKREGLYIDATMGKGADTAFLCELAGEQGHVIAFDIQEAALDYTKKRLENEKAKERMLTLYEKNTGGRMKGLMLSISGGILASGMGLGTLVLAIFGAVGHMSSLVFGDT